MRYAAVTFAVLWFAATAAVGQQTQSAPIANPNPRPSTTTRPSMTAETSGPVVDHLKQIEKDWTEAVKKKDLAAMQRIEAPDYKFIMADGRVRDRDQDTASLKDLALSEADTSDLNVRVYGDTAVVTGMSRLKGTENGKDISGEYRFTDVFVKRDGQWQAVNTTETKVQPTPSQTQ